MCDSPTMSIQELAAEFRSRGISCSTSTLSKGIEQGKYPFALCIDSDRKILQISRVRAIEWLDWFCGLSTR